MDIESLIVNFIVGGVLVAGALGLSAFVGPTYGGILAGAPIRVGATIFLDGLHNGVESATDMTRGAVFSMIANIFFIGALLFSLPRYGLYKGFIVAGVVFLISVALMVRLWP